MTSDIAPVPSYELTKEEQERLSAVSRMPEFQRLKLDKDSKKNWDLFYKRNGNRFFKNRYWTRNEFKELFQSHNSCPTYLLEIGCGCGDFILPFLEDQDQLNSHMRLKPDNLYIYCCDISDQAIKILSQNETFKKNNPSRIKAFVADFTNDKINIIKDLDGISMDLVSLIFVLSAVDPKNMETFVMNISKVLKQGGMVLFRDYAIHDKAMLRFSESSKICDRFYARQDGTRAYFFSKEKLIELFKLGNFQVETIEYIERETSNKASQQKFSRLFLQAKFRKIEPGIL